MTIITANRGSRVFPRPFGVASTELLCHIFVRLSMPRLDRVISHFFIIDLKLIQELKNFHCIWKLSVVWLRLVERPIANHLPTE